MSRRFTILARRFGPFEQAVRIFWYQLMEARGSISSWTLSPSTSRSSTRPS